MSERLPNIRVISVPVANSFSCRASEPGSSYFGNPASYPMTSALTTIIGRLG